MQKITPFLWFNGNIAEALDLYRSVFPKSKVLNSSPGPGGKLMSATFEIEGQQFIGFDGGPGNEFTPAFSIYVNCESQTEVDELWARLTDGGAESQCGWLVDRFGLSWQIIPSILPRLLGDPDRAKANRALNAMLQMKKIDIATLERAAAGE
jgi:predicted 3-demethylubiquinone-9 3-methyltransferase (glyoxalase superfamily)